MRPPLLPGWVSAHSVSLPQSADVHSGLSTCAHICPLPAAAFLTQTVCLDDTTVKFEIWDTAGQERYHSLAPMYYRGAQAAIVVYDITNTVRVSSFPSSCPALVLLSWGGHTGCGGLRSTGNHSPESPGQCPLDLGLTLRCP